MHEPESLASDLDTVIEQATFANPDPRIQVLKATWEAHKVEADSLHAAANAFVYSTRLAYHKACLTPQPEAVAAQEVQAKQSEFLAEKEERLEAIWNDIANRVATILEELEAEV